MIADTRPSDFRELAALMEVEGYTHVRVLPTGEAAALYRFLFTTGLCAGLNESGYRIRYCFARHGDAELALLTWDGLGDPSGPWLKAKGAAVDRPNTFRGIPVVASSGACA